MSMEVLEALACIAEIERKIDNLFRHGPADWLSLSKRRLSDENRLRNILL
jgi:hypothetical protein